MKRMTPRDYQARVHTSTMEHLWSTPKARGLILEPTGVGKSVQIAMAVEGVLTAVPDARILMLTHSKELVEQNYEKLANMTDYHVGLWSSGLGKADYHAPVVYAGIQTVANNPHMLGRRDVILVDEAHRVSPDTTTEYQKVARYIQGMNANASWIGYTATDYRLGQGLLTDEWYDRIAKDFVAPFWRDTIIDLTTTEEFNWFISQGYLKRLVPRPTQSEIEISGLRMRSGEFVAADVEKITNTEAKINTICDEICDIGFDRRSWMIFAAGNTNSELVCAEMVRRGIRCVSITEKTPKKEREQAIADFKAYKIRCIVNNNILTTGFDHNGVDLIAVIRVTASTQLWVQMMGRGTRPVYAQGFDLNTQDGRLSSIAASGVHNCVVLDFAGNSKRLGAINAPVKPKPKGSTTTGGDMPVKICSSCGVINATIVRFCEYCGHEFPVTDKLDQTASTRVLIVEKEHIPDKRMFNVTSIKFNLKSSYFGSNASASKIEASYKCGRDGTYKETLSFSGEKSSKRIKEWWTAFGDGGIIPRSNDEFLKSYSIRVKTPKVIEVYLNHPKKHKPEIIYYGFEDASHFECKLDDDVAEAV